MWSCCSSFFFYCSTTVSDPSTFVTDSFKSFSFELLSRMDQPFTSSCSSDLSSWAVHPLMWNLFANVAWRPVRKISSLSKIQSENRTSVLLKAMNDITSDHWSEDKQHSFSDCGGFFIFSCFCNLALLFLKSKLGQEFSPAVSFWLLTSESKLPFSNEMWLFFYLETLSKVFRTVIFCFVDL